MNYSSDDQTLERIALSAGIDKEKFEELCVALNEANSAYTGMESWRSVEDIKPVDVKREWENFKKYIIPVFENWQRMHFVSTSMILDKAEEVRTRDSESSGDIHEFH